MNAILSIRASCAAVGFFLSTQCFAAEIHDLIKSGQAVKAVELLKVHPELVDVKDDFKCSPLHLASRFGTPELVEFLITAGADLNSRSYNEFTPLHVCESPASAKALVRGGARTDLVDVWGDTALQAHAQNQSVDFFEAARKHNADVCTALLESGVPLDIVSALYLRRREEAQAMARKDPSVLKQHIATSTIGGNCTPLGIAVSNDDFETVELFVSLGAPVNGASLMVQVQADTTPLCIAIGKGNVEIAAFLLEHGAVLEGAAGKFYPRIIDYAVDHSDKPMRELLFRYCKDPRLAEAKPEKPH